MPEETVTSCNGGRVPNPPEAPEVMLRFGDVRQERGKKGDVGDDYYSDLGNKSRALEKGSQKSIKASKGQVERGGV